MIREAINKTVEKEIIKRIKKDGYAVFTDHRGNEIHVTEMPDDGYVFGMDNRDNEYEIDLSNLKDYKLID